MHRNDNKCRIQIRLWPHKDTQWLVLTGGIWCVSCVFWRKWSCNTKFGLYHDDVMAWKRYAHDDIIEWKHFPRYWPFVRRIHRSPVNSPQKGQWRGALMFSLICVWINGWVNNREAGDLKRYRAHYDVTVMSLLALCEATSYVTITQGQYAERWIFFAVRVNTT